MIRPQDHLGRFKKHANVRSPRSATKVLPVTLELDGLQSLTVEGLPISVHTREETLLAAKTHRHRVGQAGPDPEDLFPEGILGVHVPWEFGSGADERHLALEHVPELGELVEL